MQCTLQIIQSFFTTYSKKLVHRIFMIRVAMDIILRKRPQTASGNIVYIKLLRFITDFLNVQSSNLTNVVQFESMNYVSRLVALLKTEVLPCILCRKLALQIKSLLKSLISITI